MKMAIATEVDIRDVLVVLETWSWSRDDSRPEFCSLGFDVGTCGPGIEGAVSAVFETVE